MYRYHCWLGVLAVLPFSFPLVAAAADTNLDDLKLPAVEKKPWAFKRFPIMAWWCPPGTATLADVRRYKAAGFNLYCANPDAGFARALNYARQAGLPVLAWREPQGFGLPPLPAPITFPQDDPNIIGWIVRDEPNGRAQVIETIREMNRLRRDDPKRLTFFNLLPPQAQNDPGTDAVIAAAVRAGLPVISYDNYVISPDGTDRTQEHFDNLEQFRQASLRHQLPFWAFALTTKHWRYRSPSESDLRWKQYTNLAYGAKGLWYFCYWGPTDWQDWDSKSIVDPATGAKTALYGQVQAINHEVSAMGDVLLGLTSDGVVHTAPPVGHRRFEANRHWIAGLAAKNALIGFFHDAAGTPYALVVNLRHGMNRSAKDTADSVTLTVASDVKSVTAVSWLDGRPGRLSLKDRRVTLPISGGTGVLLKAELVAP